MLARDIGRAIKTARERLDLSIEQLASSTFLDVALLGSLERGEQLVSTAKLDRIASALGLDAFSLYAGRGEERTLVALPRYNAQGDFQHADLHALRRALERATALREVSGIAGQACLAGQFQPSPPGADPAEDGYHRARLVRKALGQITEPLGNLSVLCAERFNIPVVVVSLSTATLQAAAVCSSSTRAAAIVLNPSVKNGPVPGSYQAWLVNRVSICHELCHILFDEPKGGIVDVTLDDFIRENQEKPPIEQRAGAFAAELLIPLHGLRALLGEEGRQTDALTRADEMVDEVRAHFATPIEIAVNHLYNHGYVARISGLREELMERAKARELSRAGAQQVYSGGSGPPADESDAWRQTLLIRTQEAHDLGRITDGAARALLELEAGAPLPWERDVP